jgi:hypothetical protein
VTTAVEESPVGKWVVITSDGHFGVGVSEGGAVRHALPLRFAADAPLAACGAVVHPILIGANWSPPFTPGLPRVCTSCVAAVCPRL